MGVELYMRMHDKATVLEDFMTDGGFIWEVNSSAVILEMKKMMYVEVALDYLLLLSYMDTLRLHSLCTIEDLSASAVLYGPFAFAFALSRRFCKKRCRECFLAIGISDDPAIGGGHVGSTNME